MLVFSERIKTLREFYRYSQKEMAELIGISQPYYFKFEKGNGEPNLETLVKIADILKTTTDFLLGRDKNEVEKGVVSTEMYEALILGQQEINKKIQILFDLQKDKIDVSENKIKK